MSGVWGDLLPLVIGSAVVPVQIVIVLLLLQSGAGRVSALAWVAGVTTVRLLQGVLFGLVLAPEPGAVSKLSSVGQPSGFTATLLLVLGLLLLVMAGRGLLNQPDNDAPPPKWLTLTKTLRPTKAFLFGALSILISAKFWVFTLGAVSVIDDADLGGRRAVVTFVLFVVLAQAVQVAALVVAFLVPTRADAILGPAAAWLTTHERVIVIIVGFVFGVWFVIKGLDGLGII